MAERPYFYIVKGTVSTGRAKRCRADFIVTEDKRLASHSPCVLPRHPQALQLVEGL